jgi:hypothetical protein
MRHRWFGALLAVLAVIALAGCSSTAGGSAAASTGTASAAPPASAAEASTAPTEAPPSEAAASAAASLDLSQFSFPSSDKELEGLIPDPMCGQKVQKLSLSGAQVFSNSADPSFVAALQALGKTVNDVSAAAGFPLQADAHCSVTIIRIKGADEGKLRQVFKDQAAKDGTTYTEVTVAGKNVATADPTKFDYTYVKGDGVIIITADSQKNAEELLSQLP